MTTLPPTIAAAEQSTHSLKGRPGIMVSLTAVLVIAVPKVLVRVEALPLSEPFTIQE